MCMCVCVCVCVYEFVFEHVTLCVLSVCVCMCACGVVGLSITLKAGRRTLRWLWGVVAQESEHLQLKQESLGLIPGGCLRFFFSLSNLMPIAIASSLQKEKGYFNCK